MHQSSQVYIFSEQDDNLTKTNMQSEKASHSHKHPHFVEHLTETQARTRLHQRATQGEFSCFFCTLSNYLRSYVEVQMQDEVVARKA